MTDLSAEGRCLSCAVAAGEAPAHIVTETPALLALLDPDPIRRGHLQVIPRAHFACFNALPEALARQLLVFAESLAGVQRAVLGVDRVGFLFPAQGSVHACVHLVPLLSAGDVTARRPSLRRDTTVDVAAGPVDLDLARTARALRRGLPAAACMGAML